MSFMNWLLWDRVARLIERAFDNDRFGDWVERKIDKHLDGEISGLL